MERRRPAHAEQLEPRIVLSLVYYDSITIDEFAGFPGGPEGELAGASDSGEYLWSAGAERGAAEDSPAFLVIDSEYRPLAEFADLEGSLVVDINSRGVVLGRDQADDRLFLLDLTTDGQRQYLDTIVVHSPTDFELASVSALELGDDGIVVLADNIDDLSRGGSVWGLLDGVVQRLWWSARFTTQVFVKPSNAVYAHRYIVLDQTGNGNDQSEVVRWTPADGRVVIEGVSNIGGVNAQGDIVSDIGILRSDGELQRTDFAGQTPLGIDDDGVVLTLYNIPGYGQFYGGIQDGQALTLLYERGGGYGPPISMTDSGMVVLSDGISRRLDPQAIVRAISESATVAVDRDGRVVVSYIDGRGGVGSIVIHGGALEYGEIAESQGRFVAGSPVYSFIDALSGRASLLNELGWRHRFDAMEDRFGREPGGAVTPVSVVADLAGPRGRTVFATYDETGHVWLRYERWVSTGQWQGWVWDSNALSQNHLDQRGLDTPRFAGALDAFTTPWGAMNIVGLDESGEVHAVWWSPGLRSKLWTTSNLSAIAGAPKLVGNITASTTRWNGMQVFGTDERGHLIAIWWSPASGGWRWDDLTVQTGGAPVAAGSITGAATRWGAIEVVGRTDENEVVTYWWSPASGGWRFESITAQQSGETARIVRPLSMAIGRDGSHHITGVSDDGDVIRLYWLPDGTDLWRGENLTELALS